MRIVVKKSALEEFWKARLHPKTQILKKIGLGKAFLQEQNYWKARP